MLNLANLKKHSFFHYGVTEVDSNEALNLLERLWSEILKIPKNKLKDINFIEDIFLLTKVQAVLHGRTKSFRYALLTQILAKATNPKVNALALQKQSKLPGAFDARSLCRKVVVKFEKEHLGNVLGGSDDPYVSKPLRHFEVSLDIARHIKDQTGWRNLYDILRKVEEENNKEFTIKILKQILIEIRKMIIGLEKAESQLTKETISITSLKLRKMLEEFLSKPSLGARPQLVIYSLLRTLNKKIKYFGEIRSTKSTVADEYAERLADIECINEMGNVKTGFAITDNLTPEKLKEDVEKAIVRGLKRLIVLARNIEPPHEINKIAKTYKDKIDIVVEDLINFVELITTLFDDELREEFVKDVGQAFKEFSYMDDLKEWVNIMNKYRTE